MYITVLHVKPLNINNENRAKSLVSNYVINAFIFHFLLKDFEVEKKYELDLNGNSKNVKSSEMNSEQLCNKVISHVKIFSTQVQVVFWR